MSHLTSGELRFLIHRTPEWLGYAVYMRDGDKLITNLTITVEKAEEIPRYREPPLMLSEREAQNLMQEIWNAGLRPNNGEGTSAQIDAMKAHLQDLRHVAFKLENKT